MSIFGQQKPSASLSSTLLARKGQAKPAMRPQGFGGFGTMPQDDLGWNDMGHPEPAQAFAVPPVLVQREVLREEFLAPDEVGETVHEPAPEIAPSPTPDGRALSEEQTQRDEIAPAPRPISLATATRIGRETKAKHARAAFTLRLDHNRHLRLRLASALHNLSSQILVTEALDRFLLSLPEVEELVSQLPTRATK